MRLAALETATAATSVAVGEDDDVVEVLADDARRHVEVLVPALGGLLVQRGWTATDLDVVVVDVGPGLFTGLRVGVATARALALATGAGLVATSSTDALAESARAAGIRGAVVAVVDVRRGEVAWAPFRVTADAAVALTAPMLERPEALAARLAAEADPAVGVGDGAVRHREVLEPVLASVRPEVIVPSAAAAVRLARRRLARGEVPLRHDELHPSYVRDADATVNFEVRGVAP